MRGFLRALVLLFGFSATHAFAVDYYWMHGYSNSHFLSAIAGCQGFLSNRQSTMTDGSTLSISSTSYFSDQTHYFCFLDRTWPSSTVSKGFAATQIVRSGDSCPSGFTYNTTTGACDAPPAPVCTAGQSKDFLVNSANGTLPTSLVSDGCVFNVIQDGENFFCQSSTTASGFVCAVEGKGTGVVNTGPVTDAPVATVDEKPTTTTTEQPCVYTTAADGTQSCTSSKDVTNTGKYCGTVTMNGQTQSVCIGESSSNTDTVKSTVSTASNQNGATTQTKTDVYTKQECKGTSCTTSTTSTTKTTVRDSTGAVTSSTGQCSGSACTKDGSDDSDGDGVSDCKLTDSCDSDVEAQDFYEVGEDTFSTVLDGFVSRVDGSPFMQASSGFFAFNLGGSCPTWHVSTWAFDIQIDQQCNASIPWDAIRAVVLACAAFVAFRWAFL